MQDEPVSVFKCSLQGTVVVFVFFVFCLFLFLINSCLFGCYVQCWLFYVQIKVER